MIYVQFSPTTTATYLNIRLNDLEEYFGDTRSASDSTVLAGHSLDIFPERTFSKTHVFLGGRVSAECDYTYAGSKQYWSNVSARYIANLSAEDIQHIRLFCSSSQIIGAGTVVQVLGVEK